MRAERALEEQKAEILDILAVESTLKDLSDMCDSGRRRSDYLHIKDAVQLVYFADPDKDLQKGDISSRVLKASLTIPASERQVYYWLKRARTMFAERRGLRIS